VVGISKQNISMNRHSPLALQDYISLCRRERQRGAVLAEMRTGITCLHFSYPDSIRTRHSARGRSGSGTQNNTQILRLRHLIYLLFVASSVAADFQRDTFKSQTANMGYSLSTAGIFVLVSFLPLISCDSRSQKVPPYLNNSSPPVNATLVGNLTELAAGFNWAENIWFDGLGGMYIADDFAGKVYKLTRPSYGGPVTKQEWLSGFHNVLGINKVFGSLDMMYAVVAFDTPCAVNGSVPDVNATTFGIITFNTTAPGDYSTFVCTPLIGNGLAVNEKDGRGTLYSPSEGDFLPKKGMWFAIDPPTRQVEKAVSGLYSADGAYLDQQTQLLYVSEVALGTILVYNVSQLGEYPLVHSFHAPGCMMVDDFCVLYMDASGAPSPSQPYMFAADFLAGAVVAFAADGQGSNTVLASGLLFPTSVRSGTGPGWDNPHSVYVSEGGSFVPSQATGRVWELHLQR
jgi:hypothetical protein